jgi:hypothetical protein
MLRALHRFTGIRWKYFNIYFQWDLTQSCGTKERLILRTYKPRWALGLTQGTVAWISALRVGLRCASCHLPTAHSCQGQTLCLGWEGPLSLSVSAFTGTREGGGRGGKDGPSTFTRYRSM